MLPVLNLKRKEVVGKKIIAIGLLSVLVMCTESSAVAQSEYALVTFETFADWYLNQASLTPETRHTVQVLLAEAGTQDCTQAEESLNNLTELVLWRSEIVDVIPLASLTHLTGLSLDINNIVDVSPLTSLTNLTLYESKISDIAPLTGLTNLKVLGLTEIRLPTRLP